MCVCSIPWLLQIIRLATFYLHVSDLIYEQRVREVERGQVPCLLST